MRTLFMLMPLLVLAANYYIAHRLVCMAPPILPLRIAIVALVVLLLGCFVGSMMGRNALPEGLVAFMYRVGTAWFFISIYFLILFLLLDILRLTHLVPVSCILYRSWLGFFGTLVFIGAIFGWGYIKYLHKVRVEEHISLTRPSLVLQHKTLKIVSVSDLHLGYNIGGDELAGWVDLLNKEQPDIVLIAGDIIDNTVRPLLEEGMAKEFKQLHARYGIYTILGNHEYISGAKESRRFFDEAGIKLLQDSVALIDNSFYLIGRDDRSNPHRKPLSELVMHLDSSKPCILLDHQPYHLEQAERAGIDLQLSGHTHHGQIIPLSWITDAMYECAHGAWHRGATHYYISSGIGLWGGKYRIGTQSEYVVINMAY